MLFFNKLVIAYTSLSNLCLGQTFKKLYEIIFTVENFAEVLLTESSSQPPPVSYFQQIRVNLVYCGASSLV